MFRDGDGLLIVHSDAECKSTLGDLRPESSAIPERLSCLRRIPTNGLRTSPTRFLQNSNVGGSDLPMELTEQRTIETPGSADRDSSARSACPTAKSMKEQQQWRSNDGA